MIPQGQARPRLKVLVLAAAVHPRLGSEPGMGWNWVKALAAHHDLWVVTGIYQDNREAIAEEFALNPGLGDRLRFHFLPWFWPRPGAVVNLFCRLARPVYYYWYRQWHQQAFALARDLAQEIPFDLAHQLNMIGYREPGYLWRLDLPFVWGPVGGTANAPVSLSLSFGARGALVFLGRTLLNAVQLRGSGRVAAALARTDRLVSAFREGREKFLRVHGKDSAVIPEVGTEAGAIPVPARARAAAGPLRLVWSGQHIHRKCLPLALRALARHRGRAWTLDVLGAGPLTARWRAEARRLGLDAQIRWHGWVDRQAALAVMAGGDVFVCSSLLEASSTVVLEALSLALPVIALDHCGMADLVDASCGIKVPVATPGRTIAGFSQAVGRFLAEPGLAARLSEGARRRSASLSWPSLAARMSEVYAQAVGQAASCRKGPGRAGARGRGPGPEATARNRDSGPPSRAAAQALETTIPAAQAAMHTGGHP